MLDLTHPVNEKTVAWPTASKFNLSYQYAGLTAGGYWYEARDFRQAEHSGTHTDAPAHFFKDRWHTADIPLERLTGPAVKISIQARAEREPDTMLTVKDIQDWEEEHGAIPTGAIVILHTGRGEHYGDVEKYLGRPEDLTLPDDDDKHLHFPGVSPQAAQWLVDQRDISGLGIDTPSTDRGQSRQFETHQVLGEANVWGLENLANTDMLPARGFQVYNLVHKLEGGSGGPTRVIAVLTRQTASTAISSDSNIVSLLIVCLATSNIF